MYEAYQAIVGQLSDWLYSYILILLLIGAGLYFSFRTKFVQFRLLGESIRILAEKKHDKNSISSFQALMVSTASRVGVGNIAGVSTAICLGGAGSVFWMWLIALIGAGSAFIESTLAQIYKKRDHDGSSFGGPAYYIETALRFKPLAVVFAGALIVTYMGGFNMVASFNINSALEVYDFYDPALTPLFTGGALAVLCGLCIFGSGKQLTRVTEFLVPVMAVIYIAVALIIMVIHLNLLPEMIVNIFTNAFDFQSIFGGFTGSCLMLGIKRGLFSNEAGVGSAPNAAAAASVSHPVKQGLVQMLSVYIDTIVICTATAFMLLSSGVAPSVEERGVPYVEHAVSASFGFVGIIFVTFSLFCFAFTTLLGNYFYAETNLKYLAHGTPRKSALIIFRLVAIVIIFVGAQLEFSVAWDTADVLMGLMAIINLPVICILAKPAIRSLNDYVSQKRTLRQRGDDKNEDIIFKASNIGLKEKTDFWNDEPDTAQLAVSPPK